MNIYSLHENSYNKLTEYYDTLSESMHTLRTQINSLVTGKTGDFFSINWLGAKLPCELKLAELDSNSHIIDIGCANGDNLVIFEELGYKNLHGLDISPEMVKCAQTKTSANVQVKNFNDYDSNQVDMVFAQAFIHLFPKNEVASLIRKMLTLAKKRVYFSTTIHDLSKEGLEKKDKTEEFRYRSRYTADELLSIIKQQLLSQDSGECQWRVAYFFATDTLGKQWINVVFDKINIVESYNEHGYLLYNNFFSELTTRNIYNELSALSQTKAPANSYIRYTDGNIFDRIENFIHSLSADSQACLTDPALLQFIETCFGQPINLLKDKCNFKSPGMGSFPLHQDAAAGWKDRGYGNKHLTIAISLNQTNQNNGVLYFSPGKHKDGLFSDYQMPIDEKYKDSWDFEAVYMKPGDILVFDSFTPHYSNPNNTDENRAIIFLTYTDSDEKNIRERFFIEKRQNQPSVDERQENAKLTRNEFGKWLGGMQ